MHVILFKLIFILSLPFVVTGNANYRMNQTSFTLMGFTQPQSALPIIQDDQNNSKGFTSRLLWYFPQPVFCRLKDTELTADESRQLKQFQIKLSKQSSICKINSVYTSVSLTLLVLHLFKFRVKFACNGGYFLPFITLINKVSSYIFLT